MAKHQVPAAHPRTFLLRVERLLHLKHVPPLLEQSCRRRHMVERQLLGQIAIPAERGVNAVGGSPQLRVLVRHGRHGQRHSPLLRHPRRKKKREQQRERSQSPLMVGGRTSAVTTPGVSRDRVSVGRGCFCFANFGYDDRRADPLLR
jgi:hypothetical protein